MSSIWQYFTLFLFTLSLLNLSMAYWRHISLGTSHMWIAQMSQLYCSCCIEQHRSTYRDVLAFGSQFLWWFWIYLHDFNYNCIILSIFWKTVIYFKVFKVHVLWLPPRHCTNCPNINTLEKPLTWFSTKWKYVVFTQLSCIELGMLESWSLSLI